jgi:hypothetical protein
MTVLLPSIYSWPAVLTRGTYTDLTEQIPSNPNVRTGKILFPKSCAFTTTDNGQSPKTQQSRVLHTDVSALQNPQLACYPCTRSFRTSSFHAFLHVSHEFLVAVFVVTFSDAERFLNSHLDNKLPAFYGEQMSLSYPQERVTVPFREGDQSGQNTTSDFFIVKAKRKG